MRQKLFALLMFVFLSVFLFACDLNGGKTTIDTTTETTITSSETTTPSVTTTTITTTNTQVLTEETSFTVIFVCDGVTIDTQTVLSGEAAIEPTPTQKASTAQYEYVFYGWDVDFSNITENVTVHAIYTEILRYYTVNFYDCNGTLLSTQSVAYGSPATPPTDPTREGTEQYDYTFNGWTEEIDSITGDLDVTAVYVQSLTLYTVFFYDYDGTLLSEVVGEYGEPLNVPNDPTRESDEIYSYVFNGWLEYYPENYHDMNVYASYLKVYTASGDYTHQDFIDLVANTFDISDSTNIENNIGYLQLIFETETEEEAYRIFQLLVYQYDELTSFETFADFQYIFSSLEGGFITQDQLATYLMNYFCLEDSYFVGLSDLKYNWYNEVVTQFQAVELQASTYFNNMDNAVASFETYLLTINESYRQDISDYFYAYIEYDSKERIKFNYFSTIKSWPDRLAYKINTDIWNILNKDNIDPILYNMYLNEFNTIYATYPGYQTKIDEYYVIVEDYYNAVQVYTAISNAVLANSEYDSILMDISPYLSAYFQAFSLYINTVREDYIYWERQYNSILHFQEPYQELRYLFSNSETQDLFRDAFNIIMDDVQNMVLSNITEDTSGIPTLVSYLASHRDMYGILDLSDLFTVMTEQQFYDSFQAISAMLDLRYESIDEAEWIRLSEVIDKMVYNYFLYNDTLTDEEKTALILEYHEIAHQFISDFDTILIQLQCFIDSIELSEIEELSTLLENKATLTTNEYMIEVAKFVDDIMEDTTLDYQVFFESYLFLNFFQVDVHIDLVDLPTTVATIQSEFESFLTLADTLATTDPTLITQAQIDEFYNSWLTYQMYFLFSYQFYL